MTKGPAASGGWPNHKGGRPKTAGPREDDDCRDSGNHSQMIHPAT